MQKSLQNKVTLLGCLIFLLGGLFFVYEFFLRASIASIQGPFQSSLGIKADDLAVISAAYFIAYSAMQIPVGILLDRFGVKKAGAGAILICAVGALLFSFSEGLVSAWLGRFLIGCGSAFAFVLLLKVTIEWFPYKIFGFMAGMTQVLGVLGPILAGVPLIFLMQFSDDNWRLIFQGVAVFGFVLAVVYFIFAQDKKKVGDQAALINKKETLEVKNNEKKVFRNILELLKNPQILMIGLFSFLIYPSIELVGSLFGPAFMQQEGFTADSAGVIISFVWLGMGIGSPIFGLLSDLIQRRKSVLCFCAALGVLSASVIIWGPNMSLTAYSIWFFLFGSAVAAQTLSFTVVVENVPKYLAATAMAFNNMLVILGAAVIQMLGGNVLSQVWNGLSKAGKAVYTLGDYQWAFSLCVIFFFLALLVGLFFIKETYCQNQYREKV